MEIIEYAILHLRRMLKNKRVILLGILLPTIVVSLVVFATNSSKTKDSPNVYVDVVNKDKGEAGKALINQLKALESYSINEVTEADAKRRVHHNLVAFAVIIPDNFTSLMQSINSNEYPKIMILKIGDSSLDIAAINTINSFMSKNIAINKIASVLRQAKPVTTSEADRVKSHLSTFFTAENVCTDVTTLQKKTAGTSRNLIFLGVLISFLMYTMIYFVDELLELKREGTLKRSLSTPNKKTTIGAGLVLAFLMTGWLQVFVMVGFTGVVFKLNWGSSYIALFFMFTALLLVILSGGLLLSRWIKSETQSAVVVNMVVTITCMLSGCYAPLNYLPKAMQRIAELIPQNWALTGLSKIVGENGGLVSVLPNIGVLLLFTLAFFTAGAASLMNIVKE